MPNFGQLLFSLPNEQKRTLRTLESTIYKLTKAVHALIYNEAIDQGEAI